MKRKNALLVHLFVALIWAVLPVSAQEDPTPEPETALIPLVHTVQEGENLTIIAANYGVTVAELQALNGLTEESLLYVGQPLIIPGGMGEAIATVYTVQAGDTLAGIAAQFNTTETAVAAANHLIAPNPALTVGDSLAVISRTGSA
ncbi:MAG: LysM peptidoglycan-binding domain-containing protein, partial [Chloroflexi bacterium]|nr:LysM peptidoglycan-binding domain-containing protein [Chloroflexota bacterium]